MVLQLYNLNKEKIEGLTKYKDLKIESTLYTGDKVLSFSYPKKYSSNILEEGYIRTKEAEFVIKQIDKSSDSWITVTCSLNVEELESMIEDFDSTEQPIENCINFALSGTGWTVNVDRSITKRRTVRKTNSSIWDIIQQAKKTYRVEIEFDTISKIVVVKEKTGGDKGVYFTEELNLKSLSIQSNSYDFYTRILAIGKDDLKVEVENYSYSNKRKTLIWKDERYTDETSLREDATLKLNEISKPYRAYSADVIDLAKLNEKYKDILSYKLGDTITLISKENGIKEKQRIVKTVEYPDDPSQNTVEIANTTLSFEDVQKEFQDTSDTVNNITEDDGTISERAIKETVKKLTVDKINVQELNAVIIRVGNLEATKANITDLTAINAKIANLQADKANITDLTATNIKFNVGTGGTLDLQTLLSKFVTGENGQFLNITSSNVVIANATIKDAMIENLSLNKLKAGTISTNKFNISSDDGGITIVGPTMQFKDKSNKVRIQMGQDTQGNFNFILRGEDGTTTLIDHTGIKEKAIADDLIKSNMVAENAIGEKQINYSSLITGLNKDTNTSLIQASKVAIDLTGQSLDVVFNSLKSSVDGINSNVESNTTSITAAQGKIDGLIKESSITKGDITTLKDNYTSIKATVDKINTTVASHTSSIGSINTNISGLSGKVTTVENKQATLEQNLNGFKTTVSNTYSTKTELSNLSGTVSSINSRVSTAESSITQLNNKIDLKVEATEVNTIVNNAVNGIQIGGRNLALKTSNEYTTPFTSFNGGTNKTVTLSGVLTKGLTVGDTLTIRLLYRYTNIVATSGQTAKCWIQGSGDITAWGSGNFNSSKELVLSRSGEYEFLYSFKIGENHLKNSYWSTSIRHDYVQSGSVQWKMFKVEKGNKATDWTPAPEDVDSAISTVDTKIETTNNKVASIETSLSSITSRVSSAETKLITTTNQLNQNKQNIRCNDLGAKIDYSEFNLVNPGEIYLHGFDANNNPTDTNGVIYWNGKALSITKGMINPNGDFGQNDCYLCCTTSGGGTFVAYYSDGWKHKWLIGSTSTGSLNVSTTYIAYGQFKMKDAETFEYVYLYEKPMKLENAIGVSNLESRMNSAEQKITDSAIISTVQSTINNAMNSAINSANSSTDSKLQNYATTSAMNSAITQKANEINLSISNTYLSKSDAVNTYATKSSLTLTETNLVAKFSSSGGYNLLKNSAFANKQIDNWTLWGGVSRWGDSSYYKEIGDMYILNTNTNNPGGLWQLGIPIKHNTKYTLSVRCHKEQNVKGGWFVLEYQSSVDSSVITYQDVQLTFDDQRHSYTFTTPNNSNIKYVKCGFRHEGAISSGGYCLIKINKPCLAEGEVSVWSPNPFEVKDGSTMIDANGVTIYNGAINIKNNAGTTVFSGDPNGNLKLSIFNSVFEMSATGDRKTQMTCDVLDKFHIKVPFQNAGAGFKLETDTGKIFIEATAGTDYLSIPHYTRVSSLTVNGAAHIAGNFTVGGSKNSLQETKSYGERLINAYETAEYYFGDIGSGVINDNGECLIYIDEILQECINTDCEYHIFTQVYRGLITKIERHKNYFVVYGEDNTEFSWELKAKRLGYENVRLDSQEIEINNEDYIIEDILIKELDFRVEDILLEGVA